ncbi:MAG TPA: hypothetical protein VFU36_13060 [Jatrophihabitans sp.]|nr:hypothetical protein [Jatrophihabitans sp.]
MQFSLFGAEAEDPVLSDLDGLLLAGGDWVRAGHNAGARLSVLVADPWRAAALGAELLARSLASDTAEAPGGLIAVRTEFSERLAADAARWIRGATRRVPSDLRLTASGLRLWAIATGRLAESGYLLGMSDPDGPLHRTAGGELARLGVAAVDVRMRGGPGWRITSARRLRRLAELIGPSPAGADGNWPAD